MVQAVIFDWAGTLVDFGCFAPQKAFEKAFHSVGIVIEDSDVRGTMGLGRQKHIDLLLSKPGVVAQMAMRSALHDNHIIRDMVFKKWLEFSLETAREFSALIPGAAEISNWLVNRGIRIGSTTGYPRATMAVLAPLAEKQGLKMECIVCSDEVPQSRPSPFAMFQNFLQLGAYPPSQVIKVDDTVSGIQEAKNAGSIAVGVSLSGSYLAKSEKEIALMEPDHLSNLKASAERHLYSAGADYVIDTVADLPDIIHQIEDT